MKAPHFFAVLTLLVSLFVPAFGFADTIITGKQKPFGESTLTPMIGVNYSFRPEVGLRYSWRVVDHGFIPEVNNSVHVDLGAFTGYTSYANYISVVGNMRWDFHIFEKFTAYAAPGTSITIGKWRTDDMSSRRDDDVIGTSFNVVGNIGVFYDISETVALRGEVDIGLTQSKRFGFAFRF